MVIRISEDFVLDNEHLSVVKMLKENFNNNPDPQKCEPSYTPLSIDLANKLSEAIGATFDPSLVHNNMITDITFSQKHANAIVSQLHPNYLPAIVHSHSFFEIMYVIRGNCANIAGNHPLDLQSGDLLILAPNTDHALLVFNDDTLVLNIMLKVSIFEKLFFRLFKPKDIMSQFFIKILYEHNVNSFLLFHTADDLQIENALLNLYKDNDCDAPAREDIKIAYMSLVFTLLLKKYATNAIIYTERSNNPNQNLAALLNYTQENYRTVTLKELSQKFNYSERHIHRIFKTYTGKGFQETLQKVQLQHATYMLTHTNLSIESIAHDVGYPSIQNFRVIFKREFNMTPSEYRKSKD